MRGHIGSRDPRQTHFRVIARVAALLALTVVGTTGCSGQTQVSVRRPVASPTAAASTPAATRSSGSVVPRGPEAAHLARSVPVRLQIAAIGVNSALMALGLQADGAMQVPPSGFPAGWYTGAPTPGEMGPAIIAGHVDMKGPGVFYDLHKLKPGDQVTITRKDGSRPVFRVTRLQQVPKDRFPTSAVYGNIDHAGLRLITCGGAFNRRTGHYEDNIVAFADLLVPAS